MQAGKAQFSGVALEYDATGYRHDVTGFGPGLKIGVLLANLGQGMRTVYLDRVGLDSRVKQFLAFRVANFALIAGIFDIVDGRRAGV